MKQTLCVDCGEPIENGYETNPTNSDTCETCKNLSKCCGEEIYNGVCAGCKEIVE